MRVVEIIARQQEKMTGRERSPSKAGNSTDKKKKSEKENAQQCKIATRENAKRQNASRIHENPRQQKDSL